MSEQFKKWKEYIGLVVFFVPLMFAIFKYTNDFIDVPDQIKELKKEVQTIKEKNRYQDSVNVIQSEFLKQDYEALVRGGLMH